MLRNILSATPDLERKEGGSETTSVAEKTNGLALQVLAADVGKQTGQAAVNATAVHVTALGRDLDAGLDASTEALLCETHECLLDRLVGHGGSVIEIAELSGNISEYGVRGVHKVIVVEHTRVRLGHELAGGCVERHVVETV